MSYNKFPWVNTHGFNLDWVIETVKSLQSTVENFVTTDFETKTNVTDNRKLSENGNFTGTLDSRSLSSIFTDIDKKLYIDGDLLGTWFGDSHDKIVGDIANSLLLSQTMIDAINARESIGLIYDGKQFPYDDMILTTIIDGGVF